MGISVDTPAENAAMVEKLRLPFALLSDADAAVTSAWEVYDPVGGTHGPLARPAIFVVGRDLRIPYEYVGRDFADRPPNSAVYAALEEVREAEPRALARGVSGPGPRPLAAGNPADKPMPLAEIPPYFRGANFAVQAIAGPLRGSQLTVLDHEVTHWFIWSVFRPDTQVRRVASLAPPKPSATSGVLVTGAGLFSGDRRRR